MLKSFSFETHAARIIARAIKTPTGCLEHQEPKGTNGYGMVSSNGQTYRAHVVVWRAKNGSVPERHFVLHSCDNPMCINIEHLHIGTSAQNAAEMVQRGRQAGAIKQKLRVDDILAIRQRRSAGESQGVLAREYGVQPNMISRILSNVRWGHLNLSPIKPFFSHQKLSDQQIVEIRKLAAAGVRQKEIAEIFSVKQGYVSTIVNQLVRKGVV